MLGFKASFFYFLGWGEGSIFIFRVWGLGEIFYS
jgi:hypothetical protein